MDIDLLKMFSAGSANDSNYKNLWIKGASLFIQQLDDLINKIDSSYIFKVIDISTFKNEKSDILGKLFNNNNSDKSTSHDYHHLYSYILNNIETENVNILEIGLGTNNPSLVSTMGYDGRPGASLRAFKNFLPKANIYGADIDTNILFNEERIKTCYVDQLEIKTFNNITNNFGNIKYDLIIDDGLHSIGANFNTLLFALDNVNVNGWIVIEDIHILKNWNCIDYILSKNTNYKTYIIKALGGYLYCINRLV
jgi:hypothetical protein